MSYPRGGSDCVPVQLPNRNPGLPLIAHQTSHPLVPETIQAYVRNVYIYLVDTDAAKAADFHTYAKKELLIPFCEPEQLEPNHGIKRLEHGDVVFARPLATAGPNFDDHTHDILKICILNPIEPKFVELAKGVVEARNTCLGPDKDLRHGNEGTAFERDGRALPVHTNTRAYSIGLSHEKTNYHLHPALSMKTTRGSDVNQPAVDAASRTTRLKLLKALIPIAVYAVRSRDPRLYALLDQKADISVFPRIGDPDNCVVSALQINLAEATTRTSKSTSVDGLGIFGVPHIDHHDAVITWSTVTACPKLPAGYTAGEFHFLSQGFYVSLSPNKVESFSFSGLEQHGASPPRAPAGVKKPSPKAIRFLSVAYAGDLILNGDARYPVASLYHKDVLWVGPEERDAGGYHIDPCRPQSLNFADDGPGLMDPSRLTEFVLRNLYLHSMHAIRFLPLAPRVDPAKFFAAFSIEQGGQRTPFPAWPNAPHLVPTQPGYDTHPVTLARKDIVDRYNQERSARGGTIPFIASTWDRQYPHRPGEGPPKTKAKKGKKHTQVTKPRPPKPKTPSKRKKKNTAVAQAAARKLKALKLKASKKTPSPEPEPLDDPLPAEIVSDKGLRRSAHNAPVDPPLSNSPSTASPHPAPVLPPSGALHASVSRPGPQEPVAGPSQDVHMLPPPPSRVMYHGQDGDFDDSGSEYAPSHSSPVNATHADFEMLDIHQQDPPDDELRSDSEDEFRSDSEDELDNDQDNDPDIRMRDASVTPPPHVVPQKQKLYNSFVTALATSSDAQKVLDHLMHVDHLSLKDHDRGRGIPVDELGNMGFQLQSLNISVEHKLTQCAAAFAHLDTMSRSVDVALYDLYINRQRIMHTHLVFEQWLADLIQTAIDSDNRGLGAPWINNLVATLQPIVDGTDKTNLITSTSLLTSTDLPPMVAKIPSFSIHLSASHNQQVVDLTRSVLHQWFHLPNDDTHNRQTELLTALSSAFGPVNFSSLLLTPVVWNAYKAPRASMVQRSRGKGPISSAQMQSFMHHLRSLPCLTPGSPDSRIYDALAHAHQRLLHPVDPTTPSETVPRPVPSPPASLPTPPVPATPASIPAPPNSLDPLVDFLRELAPLLEPTTIPQNPTRLQKLVRKRLNHYLPFREHAPSRAHITGPQGPYSKDHISQRAGSFSAEVYRGITFDTKKETSHHGFFTSLEDWEAHRGSDETQEKDYCNKGPYGRTNGRHSSNASDYWDKSDHMHQYLSEPGHRSFSGFIRHFLQPGEHHPVAFGRLSLLLLAEDLCYAGVLDAPTEEEFAQQVVALNLGAMSTLYDLHLVREDDSPAKKAKAFLDVYRHLKSTLSPEEQAKMGFDLFMCEHSMCKYHRICARLQVSLIVGPCSHADAPAVAPSVNNKSPSQNRRK